MGKKKSERQAVNRRRQKQEKQTGFVYRGLHAVTIETVF